jgi:hypothetical protein
MIFIPPFLTILLIIWVVKIYRAEVIHSKNIHNYSKTKQYATAKKNL